MPVRLNSTGGGAVILDVPSTATTTTINLPTTTGALVTSGAIGSSGLTMNTSRLLGRTTAGSGATEEITVGTGLTLSGGTLNASAAPQLQEQLFTASGSWTAPAGVTRVEVMVVGGGGGAGSGSGGACVTGGFGGFGGFAMGDVTVVPGTLYTVTVGTGGTGATGFNINGTAGGSSAFGALISATGGAGTTGSGTVSGAAGVGSSGTLRNTNIGVVQPLIFGGTNTKPAPGSAAAAWSITSTFCAGARGGPGNCSLNTGGGGIGGVVYLRWVA